LLKTIPISVIKMKTAIRQQKRRGFTLLLTLMMLVLLAGLIVQFQLDTSLQVRAGEYRIQELQCRYAAESALVVAMQLIRQKQKEIRELSIKPISEDEESSLGDEEENIEEDPCQIIDPNSVEEGEGYDLMEEAEEVKESFLFHRETVDVGTAKVEIKIYDENSKLPIQWVLHSPIESPHSKKNQPLKELSAKLQAIKTAADMADSLVRSIEKNIKIPPPDRYIYHRSMGRRRRGSTWRIRSSRRALTKELRQKDPEKYFRQTMTMYAREWQDELQNNTKYEPLLMPLQNQPGSLSDYLGVWGHEKININRASAEVMLAAFGPLGFTREMADEIIEYREKRPFKSTGFLIKINSLSRSLVYPLRYLGTASSDTFTVRVRARLGRAEYKLWSNIYKNKKGQFVQQGVFAGE